jgi:hypothetical protein
MTTVLTTDTMGVEELDANSLAEVQGGDWKTDLLLRLADCIMNNWSEFKAGVSEGYNTPI